MKADLHNHTTHSDGTLTPKQLIKRAVENGVNIVAITDHDSVFGIDEAIDAGKELNVLVIPGIELSTEYKNESIHIIGLFIDGIVPKFFQDFSNELVNRRIERAVKMMNNIKDIYGLEVDIDYLLKNGHIITRGNMLRCLMHCNKQLSMDEARKYINKDSKAYIPSTTLSTKDGISLLREHNALAILAHPTLLTNVTAEEIVSFGCDGIEAIYPANKQNDEELFRQLALEKNIFISAGSDCHGDKSHSDIGSATLGKGEFEIIAKKLKLKL